MSETLALPADRKNKKNKRKTEELSIGLTIACAKEKNETLAPGEAGRVSRIGERKGDRRGRLSDASG